MANKKNKQKKEMSPKNILIGIVGLILVAIAAFFGIDIDEFLGEGTNTAVTQEQPDIAAQLTAVASLPGDVTPFTLEKGFGGERAFWQVYFTAPQRFSAEPEETCRGGIDEVVVQAINETVRTLDIAAFEWSNACITRAVVDAHERGVTVRMVVDDHFTVEENEEAILLGEVSPFQWIIDAGISFRDDERSGLMHNKFMIMDSQRVLTGSMNFTPRGAYVNNNNILFLRSQRAVAAYQQKFDNMFERGGFGPRGSVPKDVQFTQDGVPVRIIFSPGDAVDEILIEEINNAQSEIRFMAFSFTLDSVGEAVLARSQAGVDVAGIFETRASQTQFSQLPPLFCAGLDIYQDGQSRRTFHHKVFVIDRTTVMTGSFNFSQNATTRNDENMVIIRDPSLAELYLAEFDRAMQGAVRPGISCD